MGRPEGIIIGGGAAGLMAAITAAENGAGVTILEHMPRVGKKILSTGNGKCNLTNLDMRPDCYRCGTADFPMTAIGRFSAADTVSFSAVWAWWSQTGMGMSTRPPARPRRCWTL